ANGCTVDSDCLPGFHCMVPLCVLEQGSMSQLYADTGIFFSTDPRTMRVPAGDQPGEEFITVFNGIPMALEPTGAKQFSDLIGALPPYRAHNLWDYTQALAFGVKNGAVNPDGKGNTPDMYGSAVAGPLTWYPYEATDTGTAGGIPDVANVKAKGNIGPWQRIQTFASETGARGNQPPMPDPGLVARTGVPAVDANGQLLGWPLSPDNPLPSCDMQGPPDDPCTQPWTNAVRFAVGELVAGEQYFAEISLRVKDLPLDPVAGMDVVCAEEFGGDASAESADGNKGGKDNPWRYFLPAPTCVVLNNQFELDVDKLLALPGDALTYTIHGKNLSTQAMHNVVVTDCFVANDVTFLSATTDTGWSGPPAEDPNGTGCPDPATQHSLQWTIPQLDPGQEYTFTMQFQVAGGALATLNRAIYVSDELPAPGFQTVAFTDIEAMTIIGLGMSAQPQDVAALPAQVHYTANIVNNGTGTASVTGCKNPGCRVIVELPAGFG
ncbi:MAG: DUF11 domain-containing protein, partial [Deltaproteobacteria bacterium]